LRKVVDMKAFRLHQGTFSIKLLDHTKRLTTMKQE